jgi:hypothetical protein
MGQPFFFTQIGNAASEVPETILHFYAKLFELRQIHLLIPKTPKRLHWVSEKFSEIN